MGKLWKRYSGRMFEIFQRDKSKAVSVEIEALDVVQNEKFVMNKSAKILHSALAHAFPKLADVVSDYQGSRNCLTVYGATPLDDTDYSSPQDFFERILEYMTSLEALCSDVRKLAFDEDDFSTVSFLDSFIQKLNPYTNQCILLVDKGVAYKGDWMKFDHDIEDFIILN